MPGRGGAAVARETARRVLEVEAKAVADLVGRLDESFDEAVTMLVACRGRIVVTGMGKSGIIAQKIAATLASTGTPAYFMHPAEAIHGDLGMIVAGDLVLALSNSGETEEIVRLLEVLRRLGASLVALSGDPRSTLARHADVHLDVGVHREAGSLEIVPTASTTAALAMGDALAVACYERRGFSAKDFARIHPGGRLGRAVLTAAELMHTGDGIPAVHESSPMPDTIRIMSEKQLGMTCVVDGDGRLVGLVTDGDLRRFMLRSERPLESTAGDAMTRSPVTLPPDGLATAALRIMEERKITSLPVVDAARRVIGVIHLHDLWRTQLF
ncbi:MAG: KpsF/GutQ family sugar-phosphate isomerase [Acidobacteriia bacterium]|nr:KpsF/GutQ family sugar-phosphate isomerase [Terriglobia bacterium]